VGAVDAVYDTTGMKPESGIHVHARGRSDGSKEIDDTFDAVAINSKRDLFDSQQTMVTSVTAVNFYLSRFLKRDIRYLRCAHCDEMHLDSGYFAVKPHRRHLCHGCGRYFNDTGKAVSNPIASLHATLGLYDQIMPPIRAPRMLNVRQSEYRGGMQIWASNPALVWTSERPEEEGLHVHLFRNAGDIDVDDTFDRVTVDEIELNEPQVQHFMAQQALPHLANKVVSLKCPHCEFAHFDGGELGFFPHINHECAQCKNVFSATVVADVSLVTLLSRYGRL
jgi:transposase-like protein